MLWLIAYLVGIAVMFRAAVKYMKHTSEYDWDVEDPHDLFFMSFFSVVGSLFWPITLVLAGVAVFVKTTFIKVK